MDGMDSQSQSPNTEQPVTYLDPLSGEERAPDRNLAVAIGIGIALALLSALFAPSPAEDAAVIAAIVEEVEARGCIAQYAAGQRYATPKVPHCVPMVEAPNNILSYPLAAQ